MDNLKEGDQRKPPEEGLNGSNVPGLAPRPVTSSQKVSTDEQNKTTANGDLPDLTSAFEKVTVDGSIASKSPGVVNRTPSPSDNAAATPTIRAGTVANSTTGQQSVLQRAINRANLEAQQNNAALGANSATSGNTVEGGMTPVFNERFLFDDDELEADDSAFVKKYNLKEDDNSFPVLIRRDSHPGMLSASSAALDLAPLSQTPPRFPRATGENQNSNVSEWPQFNGRTGEGKGDAPRQGPTLPSDRFDRFSGDRRGQSERTSPRLPSEQGSADSASRAGQISSQMPKSAASNRFVSQGTPHRLSQGFTDREVDGEIRKGQEQQRHSPQQQRVKEDTSGSRSAESGFPSFAIDQFNNEGAATRQNGVMAGPPSRGFPPYASNYDGRASSADYSRPPSAYFEAFANNSGSKQSSGNGSNNSFAVSQGGPFGQHLGNDSLNGIKGGPTRKGELDANTPLEELHGEIFTLCKDQHGCRYLQKKLEEGIPSYRDIIFTETFSHFAELMTDPFGNYLCQKMLEYCTDEQRNLIVESVASDLVGISLNMHGTRAVQKTIDFLSTNRQIHSIIVALSMNVVTLIKDLNGNHVIQKCLNRLNAEDNQFIYNAVAAHCVEVATHRHGCCVLQRCIDHASDSQRMQLVQEITYNALTLVQDPFGNYVVQYILDLNDPRFSDAVIRQFVGSVCLLSVQKFSSNVIEKCIRVSESGIRKQLIEELLNRTRLEKLLRDSFANYVVQTSLDYADPVQRMQLVDCIKPILPMIRNTPYGKRIQSKLQRDNIDMGSNGGMPYNMIQAAHHHQLHAMAAMTPQQRQGPGGNGMGHDGGYSPHGHMGSSNGSQFVTNAGSGRGGGGGGGGGVYGRQNNMIGGNALPPPNLYGNQGRPYVSHAASNGIYNGAGNYNRGGYSSQSNFTSHQGGYQGNPITSHHGNASYQSNYAPF